MALGGAVGGAMLFRTSAPGLAGPNAPVHIHSADHHGPAVLGGSSASATPFSVQLPVPSVLRPTDSRGGVDFYRVPIRPANVQIIPGLDTPALTYGGQFVGPTIRAKEGRRVKVEYRNQLGMPANVHLHGGHVSPDNDGHPMDLVEPGTARVYSYPNRQRGATLWYHDHSHHMEAEHVYRGLHGFYLIEGEDEKRLRLPDGPYDVPIMLREARIDESGELIFSPFDFERPMILANGRLQPYLRVAARKYRLRLLNASTHRVLQLDLGGAEMVQIASDGGLLPTPVPRTELVLGPAERAEVVVDFSRHPIGSQLVLSNSNMQGPVLRFDVVRRVADHSRVPDELTRLPPLPVATNTREVTLSTDFVNIRSLIDGKEFDATRVDARIREGSSEIWHVRNVDTDFGGVNHTFHLHLVQFRVLDRDGNPPWPGESGFKDTVFIPPGQSVRVQATFRGFTGRYVYHCHMLEHSAFGMMAQMEIV